MENLGDVDSESNRLKQLLGHRERITKRLSPDDWTWKLVRHTQNQEATTFIGDCDTVAVQSIVIELVLSLFELQALVLLWHRSPQVNLRWRNFHCVIHCGFNSGRVLPSNESG